MKPPKVAIVHAHLGFGVSEAPTLGIARGLPRI